MRLWFLSLVLVGILGIGFGFRQLRAYEETPGPLASPPPRFNAGQAPQGADILALDTRRPTMFLLTHPLCPCTRASLEELAEIMTKCRGQLSVTVIFVQPEGLPDDPRTSALWQQAVRIPGVRATLDSDGKIARHFKAATSGQVLLYSPDGRLLFCGGITGTRGEVGDNAGARAVVALVTGGALPERDTSPVFGCPLFGEETAPQR